MLSDVIVAIATPPGESAIAVIRVSGQGSHVVVARVISPLRTEPPRALRRAVVAHPRSGEILDDVLYAVYARPMSFTGEDMVEIFSHGGPLVPVEVMGAVLHAGGRQAAPGEFTRRALANGKIDLLQAEAIGDLVHASAPAQRRAAIAQMDRGLSQQISAAREQVLRLESLLCYEIDFPEEDSGPVSSERVFAAVAELEELLGRLLGTASEGERLREGALCVVAGRPNTGKSSLFNALLGSSRAIVTQIPGTTRDAIEAPATCGGFPFRLIDTAGLRESDDEVERLGVEVSRRYLSAADVVLFCVDAGRSLDEGERLFLEEQTCPVIVVRTKLDLVAQVDPAGVPVSSLTGAGLDQVREELARVAFSQMHRADGVEPLVTRERHRVALQRALEEISCFGSARRSGLESAVASTHLRASVTALEEIIGVVTSDDVLDEVFATFCVGK